MVRVLQCFGTLNRGGIQSFVMNLYRKINREEIQFDFLLVNSKSKGDYYDEVTEMGGRCFYVCPRNENPVKNKIEIKNFFESHSEYKILHYHMSSCSYCEPIRYASKYGFEKIIMHAHSTKQTGSAYHTLLHKLHQKYCIKHARDYFACSDKAAKWLFRDNTDVQMINNGINSSEYVFDESVRSEVRNGLGIKSDEKVIGHVGRFAEPKNHKFLIEIFEEFHKRNENSKLVLVGDGDLLSNVQRQVQEKKLEKYVVFA